MTINSYSVYRIMDELNEAIEEVYRGVTRVQLASKLLREEAERALLDELERSNAEQEKFLKAIPPVTEELQEDPF